MIVYVGSSRPAKIDGTRDALEAMAGVDRRFQSADVRAIDVGSAVPQMPLTERAILDGATGRARALIERTGGPPPPSEETYFVGLEGGLDHVSLPGGDTQVALKCWACVTDSERWSYGAGGTVMLPAYLANEVAAGRELGDLVDRLVGTPVRGTRGAWGVLTRDLVTRRDAFRLAVISAFTPFLNQKLYGFSVNL